MLNPGQRTGGGEWKDQPREHENRKEGDHSESGKPLHLEDQEGRVPQEKYVGGEFRGKEKISYLRPRKWKDIAEKKDPEKPENGTVTSVIV